ncbi:hypothetical protein ACFSX9_15350 [Flavobacterium ardleyense]|uniref:Lipoprotein n=1 Tax=Flavobacterium ardleyense TaxID=2038737 RepID=A0ABW5ZC77_9FLAO
MKHFIFLVLMSCFFSCQDKKEVIESSAPVFEEDTSYDFEEDEMEWEEEAVQDDLVYPKTGRKPSDFIPNSKFYEVQHQAEGDFNKDGLADYFLVFKHKTDNMGIRPAIVILQNADKSYRLDKISEVAFPAEYNEYDYKIFDTESINFENEGLNIQFYSIGPGGNLFFTFKYLENEFLLTYAEGDFRGAGGQTSIYYDFAKEEIFKSEINTMNEDAASEVKISKPIRKKYPFENISLSSFWNE